MRKERVANAILSVILLTCIAVILRKARFVPLGEWRYVLLYLVFPILVGCFSFRAMSRTWISKVRVLSSLVFLFSAGYVVQCGILASKVIDAKGQRQYDGWRQIKVAWRMGVPFDSRTALEIIHELSGKGEEAVPVMPPSLFSREGETLIVDGKRVLPMGGISRMRTVYCNESGRHLIYDADEHGLHNPRGLYGKSPTDIMALGDSMTHGACVPSDANAVALLRQRYPSTINHGYGDNGPLQQLAVLREFGQLEKPKRVLWFYFEGNDIDDLTRERASEKLSQYLDPGYRQSVSEQQEQIDKALLQVFHQRRELASATRNSLQWRDLKPLFDTPIGDILAFRPLREATGLFPKMAVTQIRSAHPEVPHLKKILQMANEETKAWGGTLYFVFLPEWKSLVSPFTDRPEREEILRTVDSLSIPTIDAVAAFRKHPDPLGLFPFRIHGHYNEEGYRLVAETVLASIR